MAALALLAGLLGLAGAGCGADEQDESAGGDAARAIERFRPTRRWAPSRARSSSA